jgi:hypothetical protein
VRREAKSTRQGGVCRSIGTWVRVTGILVYWFTGLLVYWIHSGAAGTSVHRHSAFALGLSYWWTGSPIPTHRNLCIQLASTSQQQHIAHHARHETKPTKPTKPTRIVGVQPLVCPPSILYRMLTRHRSVPHRTAHPLRTAVPPAFRPKRRCVVCAVCDSLTGIVRRVRVRIHRTRTMGRHRSDRCATVRRRWDRHCGVSATAGGRGGGEVGYP